MNPRNSDSWLVIGAGAAGLGAALELREAGAEFEVWEASERAGGVVGTLEQGAFRFESGPNTVPAGAEQVRWLAAGFGAADRLVTSSDRARDRFLFHAGRLQPVPLRPPQLLGTRLLSPLGKLRLLREPSKGFGFEPNGKEPSVYEFVAQRFGKQAADRFAGAFVRGIFAGDPKLLGLRSAFPRVWNLACEHRSVLRGMKAAAQASTLSREERGKLLAFQGGFGALCEAAERSLGEQLQRGLAVTGIEREGERWRVRSATGRTAVFDRVVLATPAPVAAALLESLAPQLSSELRSIRVASVHVLHLGFASRDALGLPLGFGFLVPPEAGARAPRMLGTIFASDLFDDRAPQGGAALSLIYNAQDLDAAAGPGSSPEGLQEVALEDLRRAGATPGPAVEFAHERWDSALPQYEVGHDLRIGRVRAEGRGLPGIELAGNYLRGIGLNDSIASGREAARVDSDTPPDRAHPAEGARR